MADDAALRGRLKVLIDDWSDGVDQDLGASEQEVLALVDLIMGLLTVEQRRAGEGSE